MKLKIALKKQKILKMKHKLVLSDIKKRQNDVQIEIERNSF